MLFAKYKILSWLPLQTNQNFRRLNWIIEVLVVFWVRFSLSYLLCLNCRKDVRLPVQLQRAMAAEAEAAREARAKVIAAEGEMKASRALKEAADVIAESPAALQVNALCLFSTGSPL